MRIFLSHASSDAEIALAIQLRLEELHNVRCFVSLTGTAPGDDWELHIRQNASDCDAIACLVTPSYIQRPWFYAEWAVFWFQNKPWYLLMLDTTLDEVFEVMRRRHVAYLGDRRSVQRLLTALGGGNVSVSSLDLLANEVVVAVGEASGRQALARVEANMAALAMTLRSGTGNIAQEVVDQLVAAGQAERIADIALLPTAYADTKLRQLAVFLIDRRLADVVSRFVDRIANNAERRSVGYSCLASIRGSSTDAAASQLLMSVYKSVRDPQRRNLRDRAAELGLQLEWPAVPRNP